MTRVLHDRRYTQSAFEQLGLFPGEGPRVRIAFAAIVASKDDDRILAHHGGLDSGQDLPDLRVHGFDHIGKNLRSEEHTYELQSLMRISYAVYCWKKNHTLQMRSYRITHNEQRKTEA